MTRQMLRRKQVPAYVKEKFGFDISARRLANLAMTGGGPRFCRIGGRAIFYPVEEIDAWAQSRISRLVSTNAELDDAT